MSTTPVATTLVAQIAPQRSTQYSALANALAPHELKLSLLGHQISNIEAIHLGGQAYLKLEMITPLDAGQVRELGLLAMTSALFEYHEQLGEYAGPLLRPIETHFQPAFSPDLVMTRRYKGKTNESFTFFLCNIARFSSIYAHQAWSALQIFDPLAGGGTTLFAALVLGANTAGVEKSRGDVESTAAFLVQYAKEQGIACTTREERLKKFGRRWWFALGKETPRQCVLANGETARSIELMSGVKRPHLIVTDLPYGIQHRGSHELAVLLAEALPVWTTLLLSGGAVALAWESTRFPREEMVSLVESASRGSLEVLNESPYDMLAHRVDRVIKRRDVLVARKAE